MFFKKSIFYALLFSQSVVNAMEHIAPWITAAEDIFGYARVQNIEGVKRCLERDVSVNAKNRFGSTVLHIALSRKITEQTSQDDGLVTFLLERKADVNARDASRETPMHIAAQYDRIHALALLKEAHGDLNAQNHQKRTPCHRAVDHNCLRAIAWLAQAGADLNWIDSSGMAPLHEAVYCEQLLLIGQLLSHGARLDIKTKKNVIEDAPESTIIPAGSTVFHLAAIPNKNSHAIQGLLLYHGLLHPKDTPLKPKALFTFWCCMKRVFPHISQNTLKQVLMPYLMQSLSPKTIVDFLGSPNDRVQNATQSLLQQRLDYVMALVEAEDEHGNTAFELECQSNVINPQPSLLVSLTYSRHFKEFIKAAQTNKIAQFPYGNIFKAAYDVALEMEAQPQVTQNNTGDSSSSNTSWLAQSLKQCIIT